MWTQSVLNPLSRPGQQCARCNKDYEGEEEDFLGGNEIFDFPQQGFLKGGLLGDWGASAIFAAKVKYVVVVEYTLILMAQKQQVRPKPL